MEISTKLLRELTQLAQPGRPVLSTYLDLRRRWDAVDEFVVRETEKLNRLLDPMENKNLKAAIGRFERYLDEKKKKHFSGDGLAYFTRLGDDSGQGVELEFAPEMSMTLDDETVIYPLAEKIEEFEPIGLMVLDSAGARILITVGKRLAEMITFYSKLPYLYRSASWSRLIYQQRREKKMSNFVKSILEKAVAIFDRFKVQRILIVGRDTMLAEIKLIFPKVWNDKVISTIAWNVEASGDEFINIIRPIFEKIEADYEKDLMDNLVTQLKQDSLAVIGIEPTLEVLKAGQVDTLFISQAVDLKTTEILTNLARNTETFVEFVTRENKVLTHLGQVAALLKYKTKF
jgi:peptide subunit release factor 1 (eRF1)